MTTNYPTAPPSYTGPTNKISTATPDEEAAQPLLNSRAGPSAGFGGYYDQPDAGDVPDDFKYGTSVADSAPEIRNAFVRKVYTILFAQILTTCIVAGGLSQSASAIFWVQTHTWAFYVPLFGTLVNLGFLYWKRHSHPLNLFLLSTFTLMEAFTLGVMVAFFDNVIVLQAFHTMDLIYAIGGTLLFSGYIVYDTYIINKRLSPDEYIMGAISLYLDFINLFISILRLLNNAQEN
ncbi:hypothetical protein EW026_g1819 [Hermanssonia centrifuga]|uniref:Uncharacterized protein n=1 Tax=Hermanssonia centrifuga TaxID=98765 RepID=A0A4S4KQ62_9APHY|nr:hypothetical protein EW026_g1819 [Hermanssonia centrifuga]